MSESPLMLSKLLAAWLLALVLLPFTAPCSILDVADVWGNPITANHPDGSIVAKRVVLPVAVMVAHRGIRIRQLAATVAQVRRLPQSVTPTRCLSADPAHAIAGSVSFGTNLRI